MTDYAYNLGGPEGMEMKKQKMPKHVKKTLEEIAKDGNKVEFTKYPTETTSKYFDRPHEHDYSKCNNCNIIGKKYALAFPIVKYLEPECPERVVYRTSPFMLILGVICIICSGLSCYRVGLSRTKTIEVTPPAVLEQIRQMQDENHILTLQKRLAWKFLESGQINKAKKELEK